MYPATTCDIHGGFPASRGRSTKFSSTTGSSGGIFMWGSAHQLTLFGREEGWIPLTCNQLEATKHFHSENKIEDANMIRDLLQPWEWMCSLDLKDPYLTVPIAKKYRKYLCFLWDGRYLNLLDSPLDFAVPYKSSWNSYIQYWPTYVLEVWDASHIWMTFWRCTSSGCPTC